MRARLLGAFFLFLILGAAWFFFRAPSSQSATATLGGVSLTLDVATSTPDQERGLGGRTNVPDHYGMLFVFQKDGRYGFWMKDMQVPIDIFWFDAKGHVIAIDERVATSTYPNVFYPPAPVRYVLETRAGFAARYGIAPGTLLLLKNVPGVSK